MSNYTIITEECNHFYAIIGKTVSESVPSPAALFYSHLKDRFALHFFMQPTDTNKIKNVVKINKVKTHCRF